MTTTHKNYTQLDRNNSAASPVVMVMRSYSNTDLIVSNYVCFKYFKSNYRKI